MKLLLNSTCLPCSPLNSRAKDKRGFISDVAVSGIEISNHQLKTTHVGKILGIINLTKHHSYEDSKFPSPIGSD